MSQKALRFLLVENHEGSLRRIEQALHAYSTPTELIVALTLAEARARLVDSPPDLVIADHIVPDGQPTELLHSDCDDAPYPLIVLGPEGNLSAAVQAMKAGALDYVVKSDAAFDDLPRILDSALQRWQRITQRNCAQAAICRSEERYRALVEITSDWIWEVDAEGVYTYVGPRVKDHLGYEPEEVLGKTPFDFMPPEEARRVARTFSQTVVAQRPLQGLENVNLHKDGHRVILETNGVPIFDAVGTLVGYRGADRDVTDRNQAIEALYQSGQRYHRTIAAVTDYMFMVRVEHSQPVATVHAPTSVAVTGYQPEDFAADPDLWIRMVPESDRELVRGQVSRLLAHQSAEPIEHRIVRKDGVVRWVRNTSVPHYDASGHLVAYDGLIRDITDRKQAQDALRMSEARFRAITENTTDITVIFDREGVCRYASPSVDHVSGLSSQEAVGKHAVEFIHPDDQPIFHRSLQHALTSPGQTFAVSNVRVQHRDGRWFHLDGTVTSMLDVPGVEGIVVNCRDVTDRVRTEAKLKESLAELETANRHLRQYTASANAATDAKSRFLASMSHEIRTPLTAILGFAEVLRGDGDLSKVPPARAEAIETIIRNGHYLLQLVNDILDLSQIEAGKLRVDRADCSPAEIVADVIALMRVRAKEKNLELGVEYLGPIPQRIQSDPIRLRQILVNLVGNAVKFTHAGGVRLVTQLETDPASQPKLRFDVIDTGIGMSAEQIQRIFQPFTQADALIRQRYGGSGLGLTISKQLALKLGGDITLSSAPDQGATFTVTIDTGSLRGVPMLERPGETAARPAEAPPKAEPHQCLDAHVLLVEDGPDNQRLLRFFLEKAGAEVTIAGDGQLACDAVLGNAAGGRPAQGPFDLILMDMQMPIIDGYEATRRLREAGYRRPIIALTAHAMKDDRQKCLDAGCDDYLTKPIDRARLLGMVAKYAVRQSASPR